MTIGTVTVGSEFGKRDLPGAHSSRTEVGIQNGLRDQNCGVPGFGAKAEVLGMLSI